MPLEIVYSDKALSHHIHTHVYYELIYVVEGAVLLTIRGKGYRVEAGSLVFLNQFDEHATQMIGGTYRRYYLLIPPTQLKAFHSDLLLLSVFRFHGPRFCYVLETRDQKARFDTYFALLLEAANRGDTYVDERLEALMTLILADAYALRPDMFTPASDMSFLPMQDILDQMDRSFADTFSLSALADQFHVSPGCLSAHFREHVGMSPMHYITQSRLTHAKVLLLSTKLTVMEIAAQCGYSDVSNFVRRFRQQFKLTPLQFRQQQQSRPTLPTPQLRAD